MNELVTLVWQMILVLWALNYSNISESFNKAGKSFGPLRLLASGQTFPRTAMSDVRGQVQACDFAARDRPEKDTLMYL